jgi:hypothetical protein
MSGRVRVVSRWIAVTSRLVPAATWISRTRGAEGTVGVARVVEVVDHPGRPLVGRRYAERDGAVSDACLDHAHPPRRPGAGCQAASMPVRSWARVRASSRETCIWDTPTWAAISCWLMSLK